MRLAPAEMEVHVWMKRTDFTASVLRALSPHTVTPRLTSVAAVRVSMAHAGMTSTGTTVTFSHFKVFHTDAMNCCCLNLYVNLMPNNCSTVFLVTAVTASPDGSGRTVT